MQVRLPKFKLLGLLSFLAGLIILFSPPVATMAQNTILIQAGSYNVDPGGSVEMPITVNTGSQDIGAMTFVITYDATVLSVDDCITESAFSSVCNAGNPGEIKLTAITFIGISGEFTAGTVMFRADGSAGDSSVIDIEVTTLSDLAGNEQAYDVTNGAIALNGNTAPTAVPPTAVPPTAVPPTAVPPTAVPPTAVPPTAVPPTAVPPTAVPPTAVPPTAAPPTAVPPTAAPPTAAPPTAAPPTAVPVETPGVVSCGALMQEAEDGILTGKFTIERDLSASNSAYIHVMDGEGNANFGLANTAEYCMTVPTAGLYRIKARAYSADTLSNSFFVTVNELPESGYLFDTAVASAYIDNLVSNRNGDDPVVVDLPAGDVKITFHLRDDGTRLDSIALEEVGNGPPNSLPVIDAPRGQVSLLGEAIRFQISADDRDDDDLIYGSSNLPAGLAIDPTTGMISGKPTTAGESYSIITVGDGIDSTSTAIKWTVADMNGLCNSQELEAEDATLMGDFVVESDDRLGGQTYIHVPDGEGNSGFGGATKAIFCFDVPTAGTYQLEGDIYAVDGNNDSFFVTIDQLQNSFLWDLQRNSEYATDMLNDRITGSDPASFSLEAGKTGVVVWLREDGARLDRLALTQVSTEQMNHSPMVTAPNSQVRLDGQNIALQIEASDMDQDSLTYAAADLPDGLSVDAESGLISGLLEAAGTFDSVLSVNDGIDTASVELAWNVLDSSAICGGLVQEAEAGVLLGSFAVGQDDVASEGSYVSVPSVAPVSNFGSDNQAVYCFNVPAAGEYRLALSTYASSVGEDSFFVTVDSTPSDGYLYAIDDQSATYFDDYVNSRGAGDPVIVALAAGPVQVTFHQREAGARIDKIALESTSDVISINAADRVLDTVLEAWGIVGTLGDMSTYYDNVSNAEFAGKTVTLVDAATYGNEYRQSVVTDANGRFFFDSMPLSEYLVITTVDQQRLEEPVTVSDTEMVEVVFGLESAANSTIRMFLPAVMSR